MIKYTFSYHFLFNPKISHTYCLLINEVSLSLSLTHTHILLFWFIFYNFLRQEKKTYLPYFGVVAEGLGANHRMVKELKKVLPYLKSCLCTHCNVSSSHFLLYEMLDFCKCTPHVFILFCYFHQLSFPIPIIWILEAMNNFSNV